MEAKETTLTNNCNYELFDQNFMQHFTFSPSLSLSNFQCSKQGATNDIPLSGLEDNPTPIEQLVNMFSCKSASLTQSDNLEIPCAKVRKRNALLGRPD